VTSTTLPHHVPHRDPHPPPSTLPPTVYPVPNSCILLSLLTKLFITQSGCLAAAHDVGRAHPSLAIVDRPALPLRWLNQPALPLRSAPGAPLSMLHTRMMSLCVCRSARLISCRACGDDLACSKSVRALFHAERLSASSFGTPARFFCLLLSRGFPFCPLLPRITPSVPKLPRTVPCCPVLPVLSLSCPVLWASVVEVGEGGRITESVDSGAASAVSIRIARCLIGVCLP